MLKASTLIETVIAITIILTVTIFTTSIILLIDKNSNPILKSKAAITAVNELNYERSDLKVYEQNNKADQFIIENTINDSDIDNSLKIISIIVYDNRKHKLIELKEIISR